MISNWNSVDERVFIIGSNHVFVVSNWVIVRKGVFVINGSRVVIIPSVGRSGNSSVRIKFGVSDNTLVENLNRSFDTIHILIFVKGILSSVVVRFGVIFVNVRRVFIALIKNSVVFFFVFIVQNAFVFVIQKVGSSLFDRGGVYRKFSFISVNSFNGGPDSGFKS